MNVHATPPPPTYSPAEVAKLEALTLFAYPVVVFAKFDTPENPIAMIYAPPAWMMYIAADPVPELTVTLIAVTGKA